MTGYSPKQAQSETIYHKVINFRQHSPGGYGGKYLLSQLLKVLANQIVAGWMEEDWETVGIAKGNQV